jgi:DHA3 family macrolide efflux protein-like MFS transporter
MQTFTIIWFGQLVSTIGSYITAFAFTLWIWDMTGSATALAMVGFFSQLPSIPVTLVAGVIVDRWNRKHLMILGDSIAILSTVGIGVLHLTDHLHLWHLYLAASLNGGFGQIQHLAYQASISSLVPSSHLTRANSMNASVHYGSVIVGPAFAGVLYPLVGLAGILLIDGLTFGVAIATLFYTSIPQPPPQPTPPNETRFGELTVGFHTVWRRPDLRSLLLISTLFWFFHDFGNALYDPMILARSGGSSQVLASTATAAGVGGVLGAIVLSVWGGPKRAINGMFWGFVGAGISKTLFGLGRSPQVWIPAQFCSSLNFPLLGSCETALWMQNISPVMQGRVFAANALVGQGVSAIATFIAGPLADRVFEPLLQSGHPLAKLFAPITGTEAGAGMAVLYVMSSIGLISVGLSGYLLKHRVLSGKDLR